MKGKIKRKIKINLETNEVGNRTYQSLGDAAKAFLRGICVVKNVHFFKKKDFK